MRLDGSLKKISILGNHKFRQRPGTQIIQNTKIKNPRVTVGHDYRSYSEKIKKALTDGLIQLDAMLRI